ncbi:hypothetical protein GCM10028895_50380 [Pontibacter rugosus]
MSYCFAIETMQPEERKALHKNYHDNHYGFPIHDDNELYGRLIMEINQAGLSWETILKKKPLYGKLTAISTSKKLLPTLRRTVNGCWQTQELSGIA